MSNYKVYVSNFGSSKFVPNPVSIAIKTPIGCNFMICNALTPTWDLVKSYKDGEIDEYEYAVKYFSLMRKRNVSPIEIMKEVGSPVTFLCYEVRGSFCHRYLVAKWFEKELDITVFEAKSSTKKISPNLTLLPLPYDLINEWTKRS